MNPIDSITIHIEPYLLKILETEAKIRFSAIKDRQLPLLIEQLAIQSFVGFNPALVGQKFVLDCTFGSALSIAKNLCIHNCTLQQWIRYRMQNALKHAKIELDLPSYSSKKNLIPSTTFASIPKAPNATIEIHAELAGILSNLQSCLQVSMEDMLWSACLSFMPEVFVRHSMPSGSFHLLILLDTYEMDCLKAISEKFERPSPIDVLFPIL